MRYSRSGQLLACQSAGKLLELFRCEEGRLAIPCSIIEPGLHPFTCKKFVLHMDAGFCRRQQAQDPERALVFEQAGDGSVHRKSLSGVIVLFHTRALLQVLAKAQS